MAKTTEKKEFKLEQVCALWKRTSKKGLDFFTGKLGKSVELMAFYNTNKKNPKEPDLRIYAVGDNEKLGKEPILSLWCNLTKTGKKVLNGTFEGKKVIGFIKENASEKQPYISVYFREVEKPQVTEGTEEEKAVSLPF